MTQNYEAEIDSKPKRKNGNVLRNQNVVFFLTVAVSVFAVYVVAVFISQQIQISGKKKN